MQLCGFLSARMMIEASPLIPMLASAAAAAAAATAAEELAATVAAAAKASALLIRTRLTLEFNSVDGRVEGFGRPSLLAPSAPHPLLFSAAGIKR